MYRKVYYARQVRKHRHCWNCGKEGTKYVVVKTDVWDGTGWLGYVAGYNANVARFCSVECLKEWEKADEYVRRSKLTLWVKEV